MPKKSARAIVSVTNDLYTDQRVDKICLLLKEQGYNVLLVGRKRKSSIELQDRIYKTRRFKLIVEKGAVFYALFNLRLFFFLLFHRADLLVSNDLDTLLANYCASKFKRNCRLTYDSHEYFTGVPELTNRPKIQRIWQLIEHWIFPKLQTVYTVNHSIAKLYKDTYKKDVFVVRNISPSWRAINLKSKSELGIPENKKLIIIQGAGINVERGAEEAVEAMKRIDAVLMIVGDGDVVPLLKEYVLTNRLTEKVKFYGKKPYHEMMNYTYYADIGLTLDKKKSMNYTYSLPNKVFDYMHAGTPILTTDIIEISKIVTNYNIGQIIESFDVNSLVSSLQDLLASTDKLEEYKKNCSIASKIENWENEKMILKHIYPKIE